MKPPIALTIAGSDCSAGAGLQADLKTFSSHGVYGLTAATCFVVETPAIVTDISALPPAMLQKQISLLLESYPISAIKTGMLYSAAHIEVVCEILEHSKIPLIVDPVMIASSGNPLMEEGAIQVIRDRLCPIATVLTPNLPEIGVILDQDVVTEEDQERAAQDFVQRYPTVACYLKGGHLANTQTHRDILATATSTENFFAPHLDLPYTHGTGCTLSAALAAGLAKGESLPSAAQNAHDFTHQALVRSHQWGDLSHLDQVQS